MRKPADWVLSGDRPSDHLFLCYGFSLLSGFTAFCFAVGASVLHRQLSPLYGDVVCQPVSEVLREFQQPRLFPSAQPAQVVVEKTWNCLNNNEHDVEVKTGRMGHMFVNESTRENAGSWSPGTGADDSVSDQGLSRVGFVKLVGALLPAGGTGNISFVLNVVIDSYGYPFSGVLADLLSGPMKLILDVQFNVVSLPKGAGRGFSVESTRSVRCNSMLNVGLDSANRHVGAEQGPTICGKSNDRFDALLLPMDGASLEEAEQRRDVFLGMAMGFGFTVSLLFCILPCLHHAVGTKAASRGRQLEEAEVFVTVEENPQEGKESEDRAVVSDLLSAVPGTPVLTPRKEGDYTSSEAATAHDDLGADAISRSREVASAGAADAAPLNSAVDEDDGRSVSVGTSPVRSPVTSPVTSPVNSRVASRAQSPVSPLGRPRAGSPLRSPWSNRTGTVDLATVEEEGGDIEVCDSRVLGMTRAGSVDMTAVEQEGAFPNVGKLSVVEMKKAGTVDFDTVEREGSGIDVSRAPVLDMTRAGTVDLATVEAEGAGIYVGRPRVVEMAGASSVKRPTIKGEDQTGSVALDCNDLIEGGGLGFGSDTTNETCERESSSITLHEFGSSTVSPAREQGTSTHIDL
eukprot:TRINITY_DN68553_c0_g1_i1.p1 TRINITY_DN68553_c0_g1~~TRINITY_DN68553_c0_g1_i1.p1  ORF type:complete len:629 (+),score=96.97 TRINITY_DN68553_c0_g1_i1:103-1989(+)